MKIDCAIQARGVVLHCHQDWPCAMCRPWAPEGGGSLLCIECARQMVVSSFAKVGTRVMSGPNLEDAISRRDGRASESDAAAEWSFLPLKLINSDER